MIYHPKTFATAQTERPLQLAALLTSDGQALVSGVVNGVVGLKPATGAAGEVFAGFSRVQTSAAPFVQDYATKVEVAVLPVGGTYQLGKIPLGGTVSAWNETDNAAISGGNLAVSGGGLATVTGGAGKQIRFTYTYALTVGEARAKIGDVQPGGYSGQSAFQVGCMEAGTIYTDNFNTAVQWAAATSVKLAAGGTLTDQSGVNGTVIRATIVHIPTQDLPFLGLKFATP